MESKHTNHNLYEQETITLDKIIQIAQGEGHPNLIANSALFVSGKIDELVEDMLPVSLDTCYEEAKKSMKGKQGKKDGSSSRAHGMGISAFVIPITEAYTCEKYDRIRHGNIYDNMLSKLKNTYGSGFDYWCCSIYVPDSRKKSDPIGSRRLVYIMASYGEDHYPCSAFYSDSHYGGNKNPKSHGATKTKKEGPFKYVAGLKRNVWGGLNFDTD